jgi:hypothetical protein
MTNPLPEISTRQMVAAPAQSLAEMTLIPKEIPFILTSG